MRGTNTTEQHFILTRNGETVATDKLGRRAGFAAWVRMTERMAAVAGVKHLRPNTEDGRHFDGGFVLEGPFEVLR